MKKQSFYTAILILALGGSAAFAAETSKRACTATLLETTASNGALRVLESQEMTLNGDEFKKEKNPKRWIKFKTLSNQEGIELTGYSKSHQLGVSWFTPSGSKEIPVKDQKQKNIGECGIFGSFSGKCGLEIKFYYEIAKQKSVDGKVTFRLDMVCNTSSW